MVAESKSALGWLVEQGVRDQPSLDGTLGLGRANAFFLGGGRAMLNALYATTERLGVRVLYEAEAIGVQAADGLFTEAVFRHAGAERRVRASTLAAAGGGLEANLDWLKDSCGEAAGNFPTRATRTNRGGVQRMLRDRGVAAVRVRRQCHAVTIDARSPLSMAGSSPGSTASPLASWSTATPCASMTRARTCGRSAT